MDSRMEKYKHKVTIPSRSDKNKELYKQIYNAYDEFENLVVPSNAREITMSDLKKEITSRTQYKEKKENNDDLITRVNIKDKVTLEDKEEVYDINELLSKALSEKKEETADVTKLSNEEFLKKIKVDNYKTNIEEVKEMYEDIQKASDEEDAGLIKTANLSLEILSDLKSDNDATMVGSPPIKEEELPKDSKDVDFYSAKYKFRKKDFEEEDEVDDDIEEDDDEEHGLKPFLKIMLIVFGICLVVILIIYAINYFNRV